MTMLEDPAEEGEQRQSPFTIAVGEVINTLDSTGCGRVQVQVPWLPDSQPWARVAVPGAGNRRGTYVLPHPGDEVLLAFNRDDVTDCYVIGSLWSMADPPPLRGPLDPITKIAVHSTVGHEIELDDVLQTITIKTSSGQEVTLAPEQITVTTTGGAAKAELTAAGVINLTAATSISINAPDVTIKGTASLSLEGGTMSVNGGASCRVQAGTISLN